MDIPPQIPGLRFLTVVVAIYFVAWIAMEGDLRRVMPLGIGVALLVVALTVQRLLGGRTLSVGAWIAVSALTGLTLGLTSGLSTLGFMAVKTGLHAHGPEFSPREIAWVVGQLPWWTLGGTLAGAGIALLLLAFRRGSD